MSLGFDFFKGPRRVDTEIALSNEIISPTLRVLQSRPIYLTRAELFTYLPFALLPNAWTELPTLPLEVLAQIVKNALQDGNHHSYTSDTSAYCLVSRAFAAVAMPELYRDLLVSVKKPRIDPSDSSWDYPVLDFAKTVEDIGSFALKLLRTLRTNPDLAKCVKYFKIIIKSGHDERIPPFLLTNIFRICPNIDTLLLDDIEGQALFSSLEVIRTLRPTLPRLWIKSWRSTWEVARAIRGLLELEFLDLTLYGDELEHTAEDESVPLKLTDLRLVSDHDGISSGILERFARSSANSLEQMTTDIGLEHSFDLSPFSRLRSLTLCKLRQSAWDSNAPGGTLMFNLAATLQSANCCLQELTLLADSHFYMSRRPHFLPLPRSLQKLHIDTFWSDTTNLLALLQPDASPCLRWLSIGGRDGRGYAIDVDGVVAAGAARGVTVVVNMTGIPWGDQPYDYVPEDTEEQGGFVRAYLF